MLHAVIMAGGAGTRFWPASRADRPKQLLDLAGGQTMIQATVERLGGLIPPDRVLVVTSQRLVEPVARQLPQLPRAAILGEPCKRDTAPCIGLAAHWIARRDPEATLVVLPSDHVIQPPQVFQQALAQAAALVDERPERIVTFGIRPTFPAETFGYIERGEPLASPAAKGSPAAFRVVRFREKPKAHVAAEYLATGRFYWNAGIFVWRAKTILAALARHEPALTERLHAIAASFDRPEFPAVLAREFPAIAGKSIDYAVLEKASDVVVLEAPFAWDDLGSWQSAARIRGVDEQGNSVAGKHLGLRTRGTIVRTSDEHLVVTLGVEDLIVVHTPDATLVARKADEEAIRDAVRELTDKGWQEFL